MNHGTDPRAVANFILDLAAEMGQHASNLVVNKVAYFLHGAFLAKYGRPLIDARIEAWNYGPVIREIYHEFKSCKDRPITCRAKSVNLMTGDKQVCEYIFPADELLFLRAVAETYLRLRPGALVNLSHAHDGPWHKVWFHDGRTNPGMEISDDIIQQYFSRQVRH